MKKRKKLLLFAGMLIVLLGGCTGNSELTGVNKSDEAKMTAENVKDAEIESEAPILTDEIEKDASVEKKILIAYFTWADNTVVEDREAAVESAMAHYESMGDAARYGTDAISSASVVAPGNAARLANWIQQEVDGDLFSIQVKDPYPSDYEECMERASEEKADNARPELSSSVENFEEYDVIFLGYPNWWSSLPMPVLSFIEQYDFSGKTVVPFCTHGTGGVAATVRDLETALPDSAAVLETLGVYRAEILEAQPQVLEWLKNLGFIQ